MIRRAGRARFASALKEREGKKRRDAEEEFGGGTDCVMAGHDATDAIRSSIHTRCAGDATRRDAASLRRGDDGYLFAGTPNDARADDSFVKARVASRHKRQGRSIRLR